MRHADRRRRTIAYTEHRIRTELESARRAKTRGVQAEMARRMGVSEAFLNNIRKETRGVGYDTVEKFAERWLKTSVDQFEDEAMRWADSQPTDVWISEDYPARERAIQAGELLGFPEAAAGRLRDYQPPPDAPTWSERIWFARLQAIAAELEASSAGLGRSPTPASAHAPNARPRRRRRR